jgi:hypothetical protein
MTMPAVAEKPRRFTVKDADGNVIGKAELRQVPINVIKIDAHYQRDTSAHWVDEHRPFDPQQAGAIVLSARAGGPYVIDGGHRLALARADGIPHINAFVIDGLTQAEEARLFTRYQRERRNLTSFALFRADCVAGDPPTLALVRVVHAAGFTLERKGGANNITAIDSLRYIQRLGGDELLARTLDAIKGIWLGEEKALSGQILKGVAIFLRSAGQQPSFRRERFERVMNNLAPTKVLRLAMGIANKRSAANVGPANVAEALHDNYNKLLLKGDLPLGPLTIGDKRRPSARGTRR